MTHLLAAVLLLSQISLTPENTKVRFEVDSTWHLVTGQVRALSGTVDLARSKVEVRIPVSELDTDNGKRDRKMRAVMEADKFPEIVFVASPLPCDPRRESGQCAGEMKGEIQIRGVRKPLVLQLRQTPGANGNVTVHAETALNWSEFGVEDPSIFIAKLRETVRVSIDVDLGRLN